jgi:hypothetical protein
VSTVDDRARGFADVRTVQRRSCPHEAPCSGPREGARLPSRQARAPSRCDAIVAPDNYPSKGTAELGAFFYDSEGNLIGLAQALRKGE